MSETLSAPRPVDPNYVYEGPESPMEQMDRTVALAEAEIAKRIFSEFGREAVNKAKGIASKLPADQLAAYQKRFFNSLDDARSAVHELLAMENPLPPAAPVANLEEWRKVEHAASRGDPEAIRRIAATDQATILSWARDSGPSPHAPKDGAFAPITTQAEFQKALYDSQNGDAHALARIAAMDPVTLGQLPAGESPRRERSGAFVGDAVLRAPGELASAPLPDRPAAKTAGVSAFDLAPPRPVAQETSIAR